MDEPLSHAEIRAGLVAVINAHEDCRGLIRALTESALPSTTRLQILALEHERMGHLKRLMRHFEFLESEHIGLLATLRPTKPANTQHRPARKTLAPPKRKPKRRTA